MRLSDVTLLAVVDDIDRNLTRPKYEEFLVRLHMYSLSVLRDNEEYCRLSKRQFLTRTLKEKDTLAILNALNEARIIGPKAKRALAMEGIEFEHSLAGELAEPVEERSRLEISLAEQGLSQVGAFLDQSLENYSQSNYEAANAMTRTALEYLVKQIAERISTMRGNEAIPQAGRHIGPVDYRNYLRTTSFLDEAEKRYLDAFYGYASTNGSHPGISNEAEARLRRFVAVGIALLFLSKLENTNFLHGLV